jgi:preprotein translocase subunit SecF
MVGFTLLLMLIYSTIRFKFHYAVGLVIGIMYDALVVIGFVAWTRMEFTTSTIAAILTIIGYSTNNTIVVFDRIRETKRIYPDDSFVDVLNRSLSETLNRTIITTVSTLIAVLSLFIFTVGSMKDFALALIIGMLSGVFTTMFIASGIAYFLEKKLLEREKRKPALSAAEI